MRRWTLYSHMAQNLSIFDKVLAEHTDVLYFSLMDAASESILPEILEVVGKENMVKFLDIFGGRTVTIPNRKVLERSIRDSVIYIETSRDDSLEVTDMLASRYEISTDRVNRIATRMREMMREAVGG